MSKKQKEMNQEVELLDLLKLVLPKAVPDPKLAQKIFNAFEEEISAKNRVAAFDNFCKRCELPNLDDQSLGEVKRQFEASFGKGSVSVVPHRGKKAVSVEVVLPNETFEGVIKVNGTPQME